MLQQVGTDGRETTTSAQSILVMAVKAETRVVRPSGSRKPHNGNSAFRGGTIVGIVTSVLATVMLAAGFSSALLQRHR